jgi:hypothetical protein
MHNGWRAAAVVTMGAGTLMLLIVGLLAVDIPRCHASVERYGGLDLCDLGWFMAAAVCLLIGIVWLIALAVIGLVAWRRSRRPPPSD